MISKKDVIKIWKDKGQIFEAIKNSVFKKEDVEKIAEERLAICRTNKCGLYDPEGKSEKAYFPGQESCGGCGCKLSWLTRALSKDCTLAELGQEPLWEAVLTLEEEDKLKEKIGL